MRTAAVLIRAIAVLLSCTACTGGTVNSVAIFDYVCPSCGPTTLSDVEGQRKYGP